jgi:peptidoglycan/LPS O-acetylase OafA/YrhL
MTVTGQWPYRSSKTHMSQQEPSKIPNTPLLFVSVLLLGLIGPVVSFDRWHSWDALRWTLKILIWSVMLGALLYHRRHPELLRWLRHAPWVAFSIIAFLAWIAVVKEKITTEIAVQVGWCTAVCGLFLFLRHRYPSHFSPDASRHGDP